MSRKEWIAVIVVIGLGIVWQIPRYDDAVRGEGEAHPHSPVQAADAEREGAFARAATAEPQGTYRTIALEVTGMT